MKKILTIISTRPEIIRLSRIMPRLDELCDHTVVYTGQNYDPRLNDIFFNELHIRKPDIFLDANKGSFGDNIGHMFVGIEKVLNEISPDKVLILGDTNSSLCAIICKRLGISIQHLEAGNRCGEWIYEEINRHLIDSIADIHLPYTNLSKENLLREGISKSDIFVVGNPINEVLFHYKDSIDKSGVLNHLGLLPGKYFVATFHRAENVDNEETLTQILLGLSQVSEICGVPVICSIHPRTRDKMTKGCLSVNDSNIILCEPFGFFDFVKLEMNAACVISDSGTVAEETCILHTPNIIIRNSTERPEVIEAGSSILVGTNSTNIVEGVKIMLGSSCLDWVVPEEYLYSDVSNRVVKILLGK